MDRDWAEKVFYTLAYGLIAIGMLIGAGIVSLVVLGNYLLK